MRNAYLHMHAIMLSLITVKLINPYAHISYIYFQSNGLSILNFDLITCTYITSEL